MGAGFQNLTFDNESHHWHKIYLSVKELLQNRIMKNRLFRRHLYVADLGFVHQLISENVEQRQILFSVYF